MSIQLMSAHGKRALLQCSRQGISVMSGNRLSFGSSSANASSLGKFHTRLIQGMASMGHGSIRCSSSSNSSSSTTSSSSIIGSSSSSASSERRGGVDGNGVSGFAAQAPSLEDIQNIQKGSPVAGATLNKRQQLGKIIDEELQKGFAPQLSAYTKSKGKPFEAPTTLNHSKYAPRFPDLNLESLSHRKVSLQESFKKGVSLVTISFVQAALASNQSFTVPFAEEFNQFEHVNNFEISIADYSTLVFLKRFFEYNLRKQIQPSSRHDNFFFLMGSREELTKPLEIRNRLYGYVYLVDEQGSIRWQATGTALPSEIDSMIKCTRTLINNIGQHQLVIKTSPLSLNRN